VNHIDLATLPVGDMIDVLHYFFEDDLYHSTHEQGEAREKVRFSMYRELYDTEYKYAIFQDKGIKTYKDFDDLEVDETTRAADVSPFDAPIKPFVPPTRLDEGSEAPFGSIIDAPLSH
jgi:hypothetical protein